MKKLLIIPITFLAAASFLLPSCQNTSSDKGIKAPVENNEGISSQKENKKSDKKKKKEKEEKKHKTNKNVSFFKPGRIINDANTKIIYETQTALWL